MEGYLIRLRNLVIYARKGKWDSKEKYYLFEFFYFEDEFTFEQFIRKYPYANCVRYDLEKQLFFNNLKKTMKKKLKLELLNLKEVKEILRDIKIEKIINE